MLICQKDMTIRGVKYKKGDTWDGLDENGDPIPEDKIQLLIEYRMLKSDQPVKKKRAYNKKSKDVKEIEDENTIDDSEDKD